MVAHTALTPTAELALAAYATLGSADSYLESLRKADFATKQAEQFAKLWVPVAFYEHKSEPYWVIGYPSGLLIGPLTTTNGLSVTVFENTQSHERVLAIRGTDDRFDLGTDLISVAGLGSSYYQGQYQSLRAKVQEWIADGTLPQHFSVTGHSLGGFLATGLGLEFPQHVDHAYLFNAPGLGGLTNRPVLDQIARIYNITGAAYDPAKFTNVRAKPGLSMSAGLGA